MKELLYSGLFRGCIIVVKSSRGYYNFCSPKFRGNVIMDDIITFSARGLIIDDFHDTKNSATAHTIQLY